MKKLDTKLFVFLRMEIRVLAFVILESDLIWQVLAGFIYPFDFPQNYVGSPLYQGIISSPVSENLGILCNDLDQSGGPYYADARSQASGRTGIDSGRRGDRLRSIAIPPPNQIE